MAQLALRSDDTKMLKRRDMNPYLAGVLAALLMILSVLFAKQYFGASTSFVRSAGMIEKIMVPDHVKSLEYFVKEKPKIDWQRMFVVGIFFGSFLSALISKDFRLQAVPGMCKQRFGPGRLLRASITGSSS